MDGREYNSLRHIKMTPEEIIADTKKGAEQMIKLLQKEHCIILKFDVVFAVKIVVLYR